MADFIASLHQSTTGTRCAILDADGTERAASTRQHTQLRRADNRLEHDPAQIWDHTRAVLAEVLGHARLTPADLAAIGITNQIETTMVWNRHTGQPYHHAIAWQDTRTRPLAAALEADGHAETIHRKTGLVSNPYFSATKIQWLLEHIPGLRRAAEKGQALFGSIDTWLIWQLTGAAAGGRHVTDVTNAARTMLMNLATVDWDEELLDLFGIPSAMLPRIRPSATPDGFGATVEHGVPISGVLGEPQAALFGHGCWATGAAWCNNSHRNLLMLTMGDQPLHSRHGLNTTIAYQLTGRPPVYALEGNIPHTGGAARWVIEDLGSLPSWRAFEAAASSVAGTMGLYFVPAFTGLGVPDPQPHARGALIGLTPRHTKDHIARAALESTGYRMHDLLTAMTEDCAVTPRCLAADGPAAASDTALAIQADVMGIPVSRAAVAEPPTRGAAYAAGLGVGYWKDTAELPVHRPPRHRWRPGWTAGRRRAAVAGWRRAVARTGPLTTPQDPPPAPPAQHPAPGAPAPAQAPATPWCRSQPRASSAARMSAGSARTVKSVSTKAHRTVPDRSMT
ncbi:FGGY family carbohydrate kinase [Streptomyces antioxidans]|uniref:FGGY family carbohydrate kinase n=1 Tax=Streptomyces antioxidans TaxID=1507734 RepID=UPI00099D022F|nr:glycerol kinase GlpK [Streptomyces antioxidans]